MARAKQPVSIWGIEFDALIDEEKTMTSTIPAYPVEDGFPVSDTIINDPVSLKMTLYISYTPVTWLYRHGSSRDRVNRICSQIENAWLEKQLAKIVTSDAIYKDMGITSISIKKTKEIGYAREISISAQKVRITQKKTTVIPDYVLKSGDTMQNAGKAATSTVSSKTGSGTSSAGASGSASRAAASGGSGGSPSGASPSSGATSSGGSGSGKGKTGSSSDAKKNQSILYGVANGLGLM